MSASSRTDPSWDAACVQHVLEAEERAVFERDGYLLLAGVLPDTLRERLLALAESEDASYRTEPGVTEHHVLNRHDLIGRADAYLELVDPPSVFPKVWGILGWNIQVFHTQLLVTPPAPMGAHRGAYGWHQDNNRMNLDLDDTPQPRVSVKVGYFLSDLPHPGMGNLSVVPGSHTCGRPNLGAGDAPDGAIELVARAGDAVLFDRRLWHSATTNRSKSKRVFLTVGYSHRWLRPKSAMDLGSRLATMPPIRRQLLGATTSANAWFDPTDEDVPLRGWIRANLGDDAVVP